MEWEGFKTPRKEEMEEEEEEEEEEQEEEEQEKKEEEESFFADLKRVLSFSEEKKTFPALQDDKGWTKNVLS